MQEVKRDARADKRAAENADGLAAQRLDLLTDMKSRLKALNEELASTEYDLVSTEGKLEEESKMREKLERMQPIAKEIKRRGRPSADAAAPADGRFTSCCSSANC